MHGSVRGAAGNSRPYREQDLLKVSFSEFDPDCVKTLLLEVIRIV
jgi:hypothetical protein